MKIIIGSLCTVVFALIIISFTPLQDKWNVPENYQKMKNPVPTSPESIKIGRGMYNRHCKSCHGVNGKGDGTWAVRFKSPTGDFTTPSFINETDGAIFYKMTVGHDNMPAFEKKIPSNDDVIEGSFGKTGTVGDLLNYIRTLPKKVK